MLQFLIRFTDYEKKAIAECMERAMLTVGAGTDAYLDNSIFVDEVKDFFSTNVEPTSVNMDALLTFAEKLSLTTSSEEDEDGITAYVNFYIGFGEHYRPTKFSGKEIVEEACYETILDYALRMWNESYSRIDPKIRTNLEAMTDKAGQIAKLLVDINELWLDTEDRECGNLTGYEVMCHREYPFGSDLLEMAHRVRIWQHYMMSDAELVKDWEKYGYEGGRGL